MLSNVVNKCKQMESYCKVLAMKNSVYKLNYVKYKKLIALLKNCLK